MQSPRPSPTGGLLLPLVLALACQPIRHTPPPDARTTSGDARTNPTDARNPSDVLVATDAHAPPMTDASAPPVRDAHIAPADARPVPADGPTRPTDALAATDVSATHDAISAPGDGPASDGPDDATEILDAPPAAPDMPFAPVDGPIPGVDGARPPAADATPSAPSDAAPPDAAPLPDAAPPPPLPVLAHPVLSPPVDATRPVVILMIGDGMGPEQIRAAADYVGHPLRMTSDLPFHGHVVTASVDGVTDSAAAATTLGSGIHTDNHFIGLDRYGHSVEVTVERAHRLGAEAGLVTTASVPHATPAGFSAHNASRYDYLHIAESQATTQAEVMLGGGQAYFLPRGAGSSRMDGGLIDGLAGAGYQYVNTWDTLNAVVPAPGQRVLGLFAPDHMTYVVDRRPETTEPTLAQMSRRALDLLDDAPGGYFLMIEGAKIDLAAHSNNTLRTVTETVAFDEAVGVVLDYAAQRANTTVLITADHETGELAVTADRGPGVLPTVTWGRGSHSNRAVDVFGIGPGAANFDGVTVPNPWVAELILSRFARRPFVPPLAGIVPDGYTDDLLPAVQQTAITSFGAGINQLDALDVGADDFGLALGVEGVFERGRNAVSLFVDADFGAGTGLSGLHGTLTDVVGDADLMLSNLAWDAPNIAGLGFDRAIVSVSAQDVQREGRATTAGMRSFTTRDNLAWLGAPVNFGDAARTRGVAVAPTPGQGLETYLRWSDLYGPAGFRRGARVAIFVTLSNTDGTYLSNQTLPPMPAGAPEPGAAPATIPGVVVLNLDTDLDGIPDAVPSIEIVGAP